MDVSVTYHDASNYDQESNAQITPGAMILAIILITMGGIGVIGLIVEQSKYGDNKELISSDMEEALYEASQFRRLEQYDHVLLQRKKSPA